MEEAIPKAVSSALRQAETKPTMTQRLKVPKQLRTKSSCPEKMNE
jgi:hypothetical protein